MNRLAVLNSHPIQYFAPLYRQLAGHPEVDLTVYFCSRKGLDTYEDKGFGVTLSWDVDLIEGYRHKFLPNLWGAKDVSGFAGLINPTIVSELRREKYDALLIHGHRYATYLLAILAAKSLHIPILMRAETHLLLSRSSTIKKILRRPLLSFFYKYLCAACLPIGSRNADFYRYHGVDDERLFTVPYTVNNDQFIEAVSSRKGSSNSLRQQYGLDRDLPIILYASKLSARKNPMHLLQAVERIRNNGTQTQLCFVGSGTEEGALKAFVKQKNVPNVHFMGFQNQTQMSDFYAMADVFVLPSVNEPWGLVINEAMCASLPIVASKEIGASSDLVKHGENGFVFQPGDINELSSYLDMLCQQPDLRMRMAQASLNRIHTWSYKEAVQGIRSALQYVTAK